MALPTYVVELSFGLSGWIDVSAYVQNVSISRGINRVLEDYSAGSISIDFVNNNRVFDPLNTSSPLYDSVHGYTVVQPGGKIRVSANGVRKFTGFVRDWSFTYDAAGFDGKAHVQALDAIFYYSQSVLTGGNAWQVESTDKRMSSVVYYNYGDLTRIAGVQAGQTLLGFDAWATAPCRRVPRGRAQPGPRHRGRRRRRRNLQGCGQIDMNDAVLKAFLPGKDAACSPTHAALTNIKCCCVTEPAGPATPLALASVNSAGCVIDGSEDL